MIRVGGAEPRPPGRAAAHREHPWVVGVQDGPAVRARDPRDGGLDLGELVDRVDPVKAEVVLRHVGDHRHVVVEHADPAQEDPPRAVSRTATSGSCASARAAPPNPE